MPAATPAPALEVTFVRVRGQRDRIYLHRPDGSELSWVFPAHGDGLPHDLVHLVVESAFGLRRGFFGLVAEGVDPVRVNAEANRRTGADKYRGFGEDRRELLLAEQITALPWFPIPGAEETDEGREARIADACSAIGIDVPPSVSPARIGAARVALEQLRERWRAIGEKGAIGLRFLPGDPEEGFAVIAAAVSAPAS